MNKAQLCRAIARWGGWQTQIPGLVALCLGLGLALAGTARGQTAAINIQSDLPGASISSNLFGIFFEEINLAGDGGIYAELVRNRLFEDATTPVQWSLVTNGAASGSYAIDTLLPFSSTNMQELALTKTSGSGSIGAANAGYYGIPLTAGDTCNLNVYARCAAGYTGPITVELESANGSTAYAFGSISGLTTNWQHFSLALVPTVTDPSARIVLQISQVGTVYLGFVSLFPKQTFDYRSNGLRPDLAEMLVGLKPSFMRFPGGSWVDGTSLADAYHWEPTVGSLIDRQERYNVWGYMVDNGLGYYEYLQMCEDLGAQALFCINCGMDVSQDAVPANAIGPWVQEALDAIEFANGGTNTAWGAQRAAMGHAAPFNLQYLEIGNENNGSAYNANYAFFYDAIKSNYPAMHLIADSQGTIPTSAPVEMVDQHYYSDPAFFESAATMYDSYSRNGPKVFVGEYAVTSGAGNGNLAGALGEAAFMTGLERNSDVVRMASYAPLFCNLNNKDWNPDLIYFTGTQVYGTPSYYVQQMFSLNRGTFLLPTTVSSPANPLYVSSSLVPATSQLIVKVVNVNGSPVPATIAVGGVDSLAPNVTLLQLTSTNAAAENSLTSPTLVFPTTNTIATAGTNFSVTLPANSLCIFKLQAVGFHAPTNLLFSFSPTLSEGQIVPSTVLAQEAGTTNLISLSGNYAIVYSSADTNIATVDGNGEVAGLGVGTTTIYAAYAGLTATQTVQVVAGPPTTLTHRYSFSNGTANDLVGKANGVLHGNATITGGGLLLPNTTGVAPGTDYLQLPPGILTNSVNGVGPSQNDPAVTIEAWATVAPAQYAWANLFDFGAQDASGDSAYDIHACVHASDGDTVTGISDSDNANVDYQYVDCGPGSGLDGSTNVHVVCVFDPPHGVVAIYTNAALVGEDSAVTISMAGVEGVRNIIGADNWPDAGMKGSVQEFRIYNGALHPDEIAATQLLGPAQVLSLASPAITATVSGGQLILSWPLASAGFTLMSSTSLASGTWLPAGVQPQIMNNNHWQVSVPVAGSAQFFRLQK